MLTKIVMPSMGATMEQGTIIAWRVKEDDVVSPGAILCELETDKSTFDFESPTNGTVRKLVAEQGQTLAVGALIAVIGDANEAIPAEWFSAPEVSPIATSISEQPMGKSVQPLAVSTDRIKISPKARKLAQERGVDINSIKGTGPDGRIESADIENIAKLGSQQVIPFTNIRKLINRKVTESKQQIPHFYVQTYIDMTNASAYRDKLSSQGAKISYNALLAKAIVDGLKAEPSLNFEHCAEGVRPRHDINVGLAIETAQGVIIAVVDKVEQKNIAQLSSEINSIVAIAKSGDFARLKMTGACMTISNLGMYRVETFIPIIHPGETAIMGIGSISQRPIVVGDAIVARKTMPVTLCIDHRIADGAVAARFLEAFATYLETIQ